MIGIAYSYIILYYVVFSNIYNSYYATQGKQLIH